MKKTIVCFGDSNTYGYCPSDGGRYDESIRWPGRLAELLGPEYRVIEEGFNGRTICFDDPVEGGFKSGLTYMPPCVMSHCPVDLTVVMLGTNDTKSRFGMSAMAIAQAMMHFLRQLRTYALDAGGKSAKILLVAPPPLLEGISGCRYGQCFGADSLAASQKLKDEYLRLSKLMRCDFLDAGPVSEISTIDCTHLTAAGHTRLAQAMFQKIHEIL
ncbi:MAG: SGNH/GDSL hydrolase family protein [Eubacteriales bacterium]|nr:SGNH/GDSL hydrolase family protein [Eubacteriales bacterium]